MKIADQLFLLKQVYSQNGRYDAKLGASVYDMPSTISPEDLAELASRGHTPNSFVCKTHDETLTELKYLAKRWTRQEASNAFIASLWSAAGIWRSLLPGKLMAEVIPAHDYMPYPSSETCQICGIKTGENIDTSQQWYWRMTEGTPLDGDPFGYVLALRELEKETIVPEPNEYDLWTFCALLTVLRSLPPKTRYSKAAQELKKEGLLTGKSEYLYRDLLQTLAFLGILDTPDYPGMATAFTTYVKRDERPSVRVEVQAPLAWWDSTIGINEETLKNLFPGIDLSPVLLTNRPIEQPSKKDTILGAVECKRVPRASAPKPSKDAGKGPAQAGDVYAIRIREGTWVTLYCHEVREDKKVRGEFLEGIFKEMPEKSQLILTFRPRRDGRWQSWVSSIDSTSWVRRVVRETPCPVSTLPEPDRVPYSGAKDLKFLADWCFPELDD